MSLTTEAELIQNSPLGALSLWAFTSEYSGQNKYTRGPQLPIASLVLPMIYHEETLEAIRKRHFEGGLFTALAEHRELGVELQERMEAMLPQTMSSLNLCFASKLLTYNQTSGELLVLRKTDPFKPEQETTRRVISAARRLGYWCSNNDMIKLCSLLEVRF